MHRDSKVEKVEATTAALVRDSSGGRHVHVNSLSCDTHIRGKKKRARLSTASGLRVRNDNFCAIT